MRQSDDDSDVFDDGGDSDESDRDSEGENEQCVGSEPQEAARDHGQGSEGGVSGLLRAMELGEDTLTPEVRFMRALAIPDAVALANEHGATSSSSQEAARAATLVSATLATLDALSERGDFPRPWRWGLAQAAEE